MHSYPGAAEEWAFVAHTTNRVAKLSEKIYPPSQRGDFFSLTFLPCDDDDTVFKATMSFGFSVGDFITVLQLANDVRKRFVHAPDQFKAISEE